MLLGRYFVIVPMLAIAGSLAAKKTVPASAGTFPTTGGLFVGLLVGVILIVGGLTFFPALALGPIAEHFAMQAHMRSDHTQSGRLQWKRSPRASGCPYRPCRPEDRRAGDRRRFRQARPADLMKNPVMFVVEVVAALTTVIFLRDLATGGENLGFTLQIVVWLWFTVLFANFAEAVAEGRGKAQADALRRHAAPRRRPSCSPRRPHEVQDRVRARVSRSAISCWSRPATSSRRTAR